MASDSPDGPAVEKIMSMTAREFADGCERLADAGDEVSFSLATFAVSNGQVAVRFEPLDGVTLGGLLKLPRARVTLTFSGLSDQERTDFLRRFDMAFQRGGG